MPTANAFNAPRAHGFLPDTRTVAQNGHVRTKTLNQSAADGAPKKSGGFGFGDFLDIINPLQHIPIVSTLYRAITGDDIKPAARLAGGGLYLGALGVGIEAATWAAEDAAPKAMDKIAGLFAGGKKAQAAEANLAAHVTRQSQGRASAPVTVAASGANPFLLMRQPAQPVVQAAGLPAGAAAAGQAAIPELSESAYAALMRSLSPAAAAQLAAKRAESEKAPEKAEQRTAAAGQPRSRHETAPVARVDMVPLADAAAETQAQGQAAYQDMMSLMQQNLEKYQAMRLGKTGQP